MIIFGNSREYLRHLEPIPGFECPHCHSQNTLSAEVLMRYSHIWYVPFFPTGKRVIVSCDHCKAAYEPKDLSSHVALRCEQIRKEAKYPLSYWTWTLILVIVLALIILLPLFKKG